MSVLHSYPNIYALGHRYLEELLADPVVVQEKVDGSQFSFGLVDGALHCRSKWVVIDPQSPPKLFAKAVATVQRIVSEHTLPDGVVFRGEVLDAPKHNTIAYGRAPTGNLVLFDVDGGGEHYLMPVRVREWAALLGLEAVPTFYEGRLEGLDQLREMLEKESFLGGAKVEGVVIKNYHRSGPDKKPLMGKYVSEEFKERHDAGWRLRNPTGRDVVQGLVDQFRVEARWRKAVQHLRDSGVLTETPKDIGPLLAEVGADLAKEESDRIKEVLFGYYWKDIVRGVSRGLPEWYKGLLAEKAFQQKEE